MENYVDSVVNIARTLSSSDKDRITIIPRFTPPDYDMDYVNDELRRRLQGITNEKRTQKYSVSSVGHTGRNSDVVLYNRLVGEVRDVLSYYINPLANPANSHSSFDIKLPLLQRMHVDDFVQSIESLTKDSKNYELSINNKDDVGVMCTVRIP